ncbi:MAG: tRNA (guanosine(37)-N1)-methyltransferase TrmD [Actinomycetota bacterium]
MRIDAITIFPEILAEPLRASLLGKAIEAGLVDVRVHDLRDHADPEDVHRSVDDAPYGGGPGMVLQVEPVVRAVEALADGPRRVFVLSPAGRRLDQQLVRELATEERIVLVCGRYEGVDERALQVLGAEELSIGDYVLSGGELAALVVIEAVTRLVPGVIGREESHERDSFAADGALDHPHYTRPSVFRGLAVPDVLLSGNHAAIERWRREAADEKSGRNRPDLRPGSPDHDRS